MQPTTDTDSVSARLDEGRVGTRNPTGVIKLSSLRSRREYQPDKHMKIIDNIPDEGFAHKVDNAQKRQERSNITDHIQRRSGIFCCKHR
jgi:hypothetical protein